MLIASEFLDILWVILWIFGIEGMDGGAPWSHGLFMSVIWSILAGVIILLIFKHIKSAIAVSLIVFSHWLLDFITHPMGAVMNLVPAEPDLYLMFYNSPKLGLGLYNHSKVLAYIVEFSLLGIGILSYLIFRRIKNNDIQGISG
ncbi:MAG: hypothetical protein PF447_07525 [Spirochaetaceae bacterium]|nr:hypothetical protein [Spirochaetaceae bacterium]